MRNTILTTALLGTLVWVNTFQVLAIGRPTILLSASRSAVLADGRDYTELIAEVRDSSGNLVPDGTVVTFSTNLGVFAEGGPAATAKTRAGSARVKLNSASKGEATITAAVEGGGFAKLEITFTDDPSETFKGNTFISIQSSGSLIYSAEDRVVEATGKPRKEERKRPGAHLSYRNIEIFADSLQLDCMANTVRAFGEVVLRRGAARRQCGRLYYELHTGKGLAIAEINHRMGPVSIQGNDLQMEPVATAIAPKFLEMVDLSTAKLVIAARHILVFPGEKLQFKRPEFFQDGVKLLSMPFYALGLYAHQLFTDQFLGVGTQGLSLDMPLYYDLTPSSTGIFRIRHGERAGRSVYATRPGWALDLTHAYNSLGGPRRYTGEIGLSGINRSDWGFRWNHSQEFSENTRGSLFLDFPQHRGIFGSTYLNHRMGTVQMGLNLAANRTFSGYSSNGTEGNLYLETVPRKVGHTGYMMAFGATAGMSEMRTGSFRVTTVSQGLQARFFSNPFRLDRNTTLTNYLTLGNVWTNQGTAGTSVLASVAVSHSFGGGSNLQLTYDFTQQPTHFIGFGKHRVGASFYASGGDKWSFYLYGTALLDANNTSLISDFRYTFAPRWHFSLSTTIQKYATADYRDFEMGIARSIGGRDLVISYSTLNHRFFFDLQASRF
jgi:hypothetical protein